MPAQRRPSCLCVAHCLAGQLFIPNKGCCHGSELVFLFDLTIGLWTDGERELAEAFVEYWTSFATTGVPSGPSLPTWPAFTLVRQRACACDRAVDVPPSVIRVSLCSFVVYLCRLFWSVLPRMSTCAYLCQFVYIVLCRAVVSCTQAWSWSGSTLRLRCVIVSLSAARHPSQETQQTGILNVHNMLDPVSHFYDDALHLPRKQMYEQGNSLARQMHAVRRQRQYILVY